MYTVKFSPYRERLGRIMLRQTAGHEGVSADGKYRFCMGNDVREADFWVVQGKGVQLPQTCRVAPENTIFLSTEPRSVLVYPRKYLAQFGMVCTCQEHVHHNNVVLAPPVLPWLVGCHEDERHNYVGTRDFDSLSSVETSAKTKLISVITSNKAFTRGHVRRIEFVRQLKEYYGDKLDVFGRGFNDFADKWDVLAPYKYHIAIENCGDRYYWTEKLSDCFLTETFPFYFGCSNVFDYFSPVSLQHIDISDFERTVHIIDACMAADLYGQRREALCQAKAQVLGMYNMFNFIGSLCDRLDAGRTKQEVTLQPCHSADEWRNVWRYSVERSFYKTLLKVRS